MVSEFFKAIFKDVPGYIELRAIGENVYRNSFALGDPGVWEKVQKWTDLHNQKRHCYFSLCPRKTEAGTEIKDVSGISILWADLDAHGKPKEGAWELVQALTPSPSIIVDSGGGYHAYWLLDTFYPTPDDETRDDANGIVRGLAFHMHGDPAATDLARIFRIPGTENIKPEVMKTAEILEFHPDLRYPISVFSGMKVSVTAKEGLSEKTPLYQRPREDMAKALRGCEFFAWCFDHAEHIPEPLWYGMITSLIRYEDGEEVIHEISSNDPRYKLRETQRKILHAINAGYPHTCKYLEATGWGFECSKMEACKCLTPGRYRKI